MVIYTSRKNVILYIILSLFITANAQNLTFVSVVHRHGDRTPEWVYPTDPYPESMWNGLGQLTPQGRKQLYGLGKYMRERYENFLPLNYKNGDIYVESSEVPRTVLSAIYSLGGLYGLDDIVNGPMIPINVVPSALDNRIAFSKPCPKMDKLGKETIENAITGETLDRYNAVLGNLSYHVGMEINWDNIIYAFLVADTLNIESSKGLVLPDWAADFYPEPLREMADTIVFKLPFSTKELKRLYCGPLLKDILWNFDDVTNGKNVLKIWQYSGHDTTVARILSCLNVFDGEPPDYASAVFVELYKNSNIRYEVLVTYKTGDIVQELTVPGCSLYCPLDRLKELLSDVIPGDWEAECAA